MKAKKDCYMEKEKRNKPRNVSKDIKLDEYLVHEEYLKEKLKFQEIVNDERELYKKDILK